MDHKMGKIWTEYRGNLDISNRKYTITHNDETGDLYVTIGACFADDQFGPMRDEVILQWVDLDGVSALVGKVLVSGDGLEDTEGIRQRIFMQEIPMALQALVEADGELFARQPDLLAAPVIIYFQEGEEGQFYRYALTEAGIS